MKCLIISRLLSSRLKTSNLLEVMSVDQHALIQRIVSSTENKKHEQHDYQQGTPREKPLLLFPLWWAVPVVAVITAIFGSTGNHRNQHRQKMKYREPPKKNAILHYCQKCSTKNPKCRQPPKTYRQKHTTILLYRLKRIPSFPFFSSCSCFSSF